MTRTRPPDFALLEREMRRLVDVSAATVVHDPSAGMAIFVDCPTRRATSDLIRDIRSLALVEFDLDLGDVPISVSYPNGPAVVDLREPNHVQQSAPAADAPTFGDTDLGAARSEGEAEPVSLVEIELHHSSHACEAKVVLRRGDEVATGTAAGLPVDRSIHRAVAEATIDAVHGVGFGPLGIDRAVVVSLEGLEVAIATLVVVGRQSDQMVAGIAPVRYGRAPDAIVSAVLNAVDTAPVRGRHLASSR